MPEAHDRPGRPAGGEEDLASACEQSLKTQLQGDVIPGRVVSIGRDAVTVDIGYKCEGAIPLHEFLDHDGNCTVALGDDIDVLFEGTDQESGAVHLSRQKALQLVVWRDVERAFQDQGTVEGTLVGKVKGGLKVDIGVAAFLPGSHADLRPARNLDRYVGQRGRFAVLKFNRSRGNVVVSLAIGKALKDLPLPTNCVISGIIRKGEIVMPRGVTVLEEADEIFALVDDLSREQLAKLLGRP